MAKRSGLLSWMLLLALAPMAASAGLDTSIDAEASMDLDGFSVPTRAPRPNVATNNESDLRVLWIDVQELASSLFAGAATEASSTLSREGLRTSFRKVAAGGAEGASDVRIILLPRSQAPRPAGPLVMGAVSPNKLRLGEARAVWVYLEPVLGALGLRSAGENPRAVSRALGRVVAHELIHTMVPQLEHSKRGLMAAKLTVRELCRPEVDLESAFRRALRSPLSRPLASAALAED